MTHIVNQYFPGAVVAILGLVVLAIAASRPIPPPGTPWPTRRPRRLRPGRQLDQDREPIVIDAELVDEVDERTAAELRELSMRAHPSYRPPRRTLRRL